MVRGTTWLKMWFGGGYINECFFLFLSCKENKNKLEKERR